MLKENKHPPPDEPGVAELEVLPTALGTPTALAPLLPQPPTPTDIAGHAAVGHGSHTTPASTYYNNANDAYFVYLTRDRQQLNSQRRT